MSSVFENDKKYIAGTYKRFPVNIVEGHGAIAVDSDGKEYIDLGSGIGVNSFGYSDPVWCEAVKKQVDTLQHTSNLYYSDPCVKLAQALCEKTGMSKVFFSNSGAEANECAIKAARKYAEEKKGSEYCTVITLVNSFHGRTLATLAATGQEVFHRDFLPVTDGFDYALAGDIEDVKNKVAANKTAAIMFECVQGEGGVIPLEKEFVKELETIARENDILLIVDEVQTGNGRTGTLYSYMQYGINPDIVTTAKGLGGGLPIGATLFSEKVSGVYTPGTHGSTFGGNPVACAGALTVIGRLDDAMLDEIKAKSGFVFEKLSGCDKIKSVSGLGLMIGFEPAEKKAADVVSALLQKGVLALTAKDKVRLLPPLNIDRETLGRALDIITETLLGE